MEKSVVVINKKISSETREIQVNGDIIVPDIKPDIVSIIDTNAIPYIYKEDISNGRIRIDGNIDTYVVYLADNGDTRSIQTTLTFSESFENDIIKEKCFSKENLNLQVIESKVLNERKISIKASLKIGVDAYEKQQVEFNNSMENLEKVELLKENLDIKSLIGMNRVKTSIKEDISVDNSLDIVEIIKTNIEIENFENKISYNKVLAKADANVKIIFLTEDNKIGIAQAQIPVMSFIDIEKINDKNVCNVDYSIRNMLFKVNSKEMHSISCQVDFEVNCEAYECQNLEIIQDMYGIKNDIDYTKKDVEVELYNNLPSEKVNINERVLIEDILNIYDVNKRVKVLKSTKSANFYNYECELNLNFYYEADNRTGLNVKSITLPFMVKIDGEEDELNFNITKNQFTINNENVDCELEIYVQKSNTNVKKISIIEDVEVKECQEDSDYKMYMYFVKQGDTIWKISKRYKVPMEEIIKLNGLENPDRIDVGQRLYIMR